MQLLSSRGQVLASGTRHVAGACAHAEHLHPTPPHPPPPAATGAGARRAGCGARTAASPATSCAWWVGLRGVRASGPLAEPPAAGALRCCLRRTCAHSMPMPLTLCASPIPCRQVLAYVARDSPELLPPLFRWTCALVPSKAAYLRRRPQYLWDHLAGILQPGEIEWLSGHPRPALAVNQASRGSRGPGACAVLRGGAQINALSGRRKRLPACMAAAAPPPHFLPPALAPYAGVVQHASPRQRADRL